MKKILILLSSLIFIISTLTYVNTNILKQLMVEAPLMMDDGNFQVIMKEIVTFTPVYDIVPKELHNEVDKVIENVSKDKRIQEIMMRQSNNALSDIVNGTNTFSEAVIADDIMLMLDDYTTEIEEKTHNLITKDKMRNELEKQLIGFNLSKKYEAVLQSVESKLSPNQLRVLNMAYKISDNIKLITATSIIAAILSFLILLKVSLKARILIPIITSILIIINGSVLPFIVSKSFSKLGLDSTGVNIDSKILIQAFIFSVLMVLIGLGLNIYQNKQVNKEVY